MRQVKCRDTGEYKPITEAFKDPEKKQSVYYSSEQAWLTEKRNSEYRLKCCCFLKEILGIDDGQLLPTAFQKKLKELSGYGYEVVYETMLRNKNSIEWALENVKFKSDWNVASYVFAIIGNNIRKVSKEMKQARIQKAREKIDSGEVLDFQNQKQQTVDISKFVGDVDD